MKTTMPTSELDPHFQSLDNAQALALANFSGVYFLCQGATVVYVGRAKNIARRLANHFDRKDFDSVMVMRVSEEMLSSVEMHWIQRLQPELNRHAGRPSLGDDHNGRIVVMMRLSPDLHKALRVAVRKKKARSANAYIEAALREKMIADGLIKPGLPLQ
jgi:excinuclease UvrABC nuclease subunit